MCEIYNQIDPYAVVNQAVQQGQKEKASCKIDRALELLEILVARLPEDGKEMPKNLGKIPGRALNDTTLFKYSDLEGKYIVEYPGLQRYTPSQLLQTLTEVVASLKCAGVK